MLESKGWQSATYLALRGTIGIESQMHDEGYLFHRDHFETATKT